MPGFCSNCDVGMLLTILTVSATLGSLFCCVIMWRVALVLFIGCVLFIKMMAKKKEASK